METPDNDQIFVLRTGLTVEQCLDRFREETDAGGFWGVKDVSSRFEGRQVLLWIRHDFLGSFRPYFEGELLAEAGGTVIRGRFRLHQAVRPMGWIMALCCLLFGARMFWMAQRGMWKVTGEGPEPVLQVKAAVFAAVGVLMMLAALAVVPGIRFLGSKFGRESRSQILLHLKTWLAAEGP